MTSVVICFSNVTHFKFTNFNKCIFVAINMWFVFEEKRFELTNIWRKIYQNAVRVSCRHWHHDPGKTKNTKCRLFLKRSKDHFTIINWCFWWRPQNLDEIFKFSFDVEKLSRENWKVPSTFWGLFKPNWITDWRFTNFLHEIDSMYNNFTCKKCKSIDNQLSKFGVVSYLIEK